MARGRLEVSPEVAAAHPSYRAAVIYATGLVNGPSTDAGRAELAAAGGRARERSENQRLAEKPQVAAWRQVFNSFGAKPCRYPSSVEALLARSLRDGSPPPVNALVDAYNAVSLDFLLPIGGEDWGRLVGNGVLRFARGDEGFVVFHGNDEEVSNPKPGEVIWADDEGVTCRRWNWRQCLRTQLTEQTTEAYFLLEAIGDYPDDELEAATEALVEAAQRVSPSAQFSRERLRPAAA
ncbi:MAG: B3/4 domain-containing protein [Solirubrobacterales bacterium]